MNIIDVQDQLKNFSEQQLISEMQMPSGSAPQFLVLSEIKRRKRVRDDFMKREAANQPTVAEEAIAAAGVPQSGVMGMSEAMAPQAAVAEGGIGSVMPQSMRPQTMPAPTDDAIPMRSGGLAQFGQELSGKVSEGVEPFLDEVEGMAQDRFGVDVSGPLQGGIADLSRPPYEIARPTQDFMGRIPPFMRQPGFSAMPAVLPAFPIRRGGKGGPRAVGFNEGGVVRANIGAFFNPDGTPTVAGLKALIAQESGGDPTARGSLDEVGIAQIRPSTAIMPGYGAQSMFPEIASLIGPGKKYDTDKMEMAEAVQKAYEDNRELVDAGLIDVDKSMPFSRDYLTAMSKEFPDDPNRALAAYNVGPGTASELENPAEFDYVTSVLGRMDGGSDEQQSIRDMIVDAAKSTGSAVSNALISPAAASGSVMTEVEEEEPDTKVRDFEGRVIGDTSLGPSLRENPDPGSYQYDPETGEVIGDTMAKEERRLLNEAINMGRMYEFMYRDRDPDDLGNIGMDSSALGSGAITGSTAGMDPSQIAEVNPPPASTDVNRASASEAPVLQAGSKEDKITFPDQTTTTNVEGDTTTVEGSTIAPTTIVGGESGTYDASGLAAEIKSLQEKLDKDRETDKYLALAQAGLALMSSKDPTLLGAVGEAGVSGLKAYRDAQDRYQEGVIDLINARAKLKGKSGSSFTANQMIQRAQDLQTMAKEAELSGNSQRARELEMAANSLLMEAGVTDDGGSAISGFADQ